MREPYSSWKIELDLWADATGYEKHQIGPVIVLSLEGDARETCLTIPKENFKSEDAMDYILEKLDSLYEKDETQIAFLAIDQFVNYRRPQDMEMNEFLRKFELMKNKCSTYDLKLPDGVLAYFMLKCANLPDDKSDIVRATISKLTVENVRTKILSIYTQVAKSSSSAVKFEDQNDSFRFNSIMSLKEEPTYYESPSPVMYEHNSHNSHRGRGRGRDKGKNAGRLGRGNNQNRRSSNGVEQSSYSQCSSNYEGRLNPVDPRTGQPSLCNTCGSYRHWETHCPDSPPPQFNNRRGNYHSGYSNNSRKYESPL